MLLSLYLIIFTVQLLKVQPFGTHRLFVYKRVAAGKVGDGSRVELVTGVDRRAVVHRVVRTSTPSVHFLCAFSTVLRHGREKKTLHKTVIIICCSPVYVRICGVKTNISYKILLRLTVKLNILHIGWKAFVPQTNSSSSFFLNATLM